MRKRLGTEVAAQHTIDVVKHVAIECRGDADGIVVSSVETGLVFLGVDADQKPAFVVGKTVQVDVGEKSPRGGWCEVADRRARIEKSRRRIAKVVPQVESVREVGHDPEHFDFGEIERHRRQCALDLRRRDIDGDVARGLEERQPALRLAAVAGAKVDELSVAADGSGDRIAVLAEDRALGSRRIVLGQFADRAEQRATQRVVEILGWNRRRRSAQASDERLALGRRVAAKTGENSIGHRRVSERAAAIGCPSAATLARRNIC